MSRPAKRLDPAAPAWRSALVRLRHKPRLLVLDVDGTLAPLASRPDEAKVPAETLGLLRRLAGCPGVTLAFLSGRRLADLPPLLGKVRAWYVGNHGLDASVPGLGLSVRDRRVWQKRFREIRRRVEPLIAELSGSWLEDKGTDLSLHYRQAAKSRVPSWLRRVRALLQGWPVRLSTGKKVLEVRPGLELDKGHALRRMIRRARLGRGGVCLFMGDDRTDEDAFLVLRPREDLGVSIKVGPGPTRAEFRVSGPVMAARFLEMAARTIKCTKT